jgi:hypothetical protein
MNELPPAMELLKDWSTWMVGLQTGILGLIAFIGGKDGFFKLEEKWARLAIFLIGASMFFATWVLAALPSILLRMQTKTDNFYNMGMFEWLPVPLWVFSSLQHWLFVIGVLFLMLSISKKLKS